ncbi:hypothetical protein BCR32DRAFT_264274 [Anaeromyces robustus]|uniref:Uncharacterized protein n=1 Tax=Anaeromyces robustus TaxID=1754192 RepID=A0A1Y1XP37_9FUNG|nr:hypothetical protein BCR32DRAFT_264274 [Anaeromyces robustus]|eukprot:ORX87510.1 hypothetical protein BCR32DRAFT_264274 [Anaeromyces robustus]
MSEPITEETQQELGVIEETKEEIKKDEAKEIAEKPTEEAVNKESEEVTPTEIKEEEKKTEEGGGTTTEETKEASDETNDSKKTEETKSEEVTSEGSKTEEVKAEVKTEEVKTEETKETTNNDSEEKIESTKKSDEKESKSVKNSTSKLNEKESKSVHGSRTKLNGSESNLAKKRASREVLNKYRSKTNLNLYGSINNLKGSRNNLAGSKTFYGSSMLLNKNHLYHDQNQEPTDRITYENTYQLKPTKKFSSYEVKKMLDELLQKKFVTVHQEEDEDPETIYFQYETKKAQEMSKELANEILEEVKKFEYDRYKFVVDVTIGEYTGQGVRVSSRAIWDTSTDSYASSTYRHGNVFVTAIVFGCYYE